MIPILKPGIQNWKSDITFLTHSAFCEIIFKLFFPCWFFFKRKETKLIANNDFLFLKKVFIPLLLKLLITLFPVLRLKSFLNIYTFSISYCVLFYFIITFLYQTKWRRRKCWHKCTKKMLPMGYCRVRKFIVFIQIYKTFQTISIHWNLFGFSCQTCVTNTRPEINNLSGN